MKIPKYIEQALNRRTKLAVQLDEADMVIFEFITKNDIDVESCDYAGGVEMYANPYDSAERIREAILNTEK